MQIFCTDGTTVECTSFRAVDSGILLFDEEPEDESEHGEATGFVPITQLKYVLPDDAQPAQPQGALQGARQPPASVPGGGQQTGGGMGGRQQPSSVGLQQGSRGTGGPSGGQPGPRGSGQGPPGSGRQ